MANMAAAGMKDFLSNAFRYQAALKPVSIGHLRRGAPGNLCKQGISGQAPGSSLSTRGSGCLSKGSLSTVYVF